MLSDEAIEDGACLARNSVIHSGLEDDQIKIIGKHVSRQCVPLHSVMRIKNVIP